MATIFWAGRKVVFTGQLNSMNRKMAKELLERRGAIVTNSVSKKTDDIVVGQLKVISRKQLAAQRLNEDGHLISILTEDEFLEML